MREPSQPQDDYTLLDILDEIAGHDRDTFVKILSGIIGGLSCLKEEMCRHDYSRLPAILDEIGRLRGLHQAVALVFWGGTLEALSSGDIWKDRHTLSENQAGVFCRMVMVRTPVTAWAEAAVKYPYLFDIPGFADDLDRLVKSEIGRCLESDPERAKQIARSLAPGCPVHETLALPWLIDSVCSFPLPPDHYIWKLLGGSGAWDGLTESEKTERYQRLFQNIANVEKLAFGLYSMWVRHISKEPDEKDREANLPSANSVSRAIAAGLIHRGVQLKDSDTGEVVEEFAEDQAATRFISQLEESDELERIITRAKLSDGERLVLSGMKQGLEGNGLSRWASVTSGGKLRATSVPELAKRVRQKLRAAAKT